MVLSSFLFSSFIPDKKFLFLQHMNVLVIDVMVKEYWEVDESGTITDNCIWLNELMLLFESYNTFQRINSFIVFFIRYYSCLINDRYLKLLNYTNTTIQH